MKLRQSLLYWFIGALILSCQPADEIAPPKPRDQSERYGGSDRQIEKQKSSQDESKNEGAVLQYDPLVKPLGSFPQEGPSTSPTTPGGETPPQGQEQQENPDCYKASDYICQIEVLITKYTNNYRQQSGLRPLKHHARLSFTARNWSQGQFQRGGISHTGFPSARRSHYRSEFGVLDINITSENVAMVSGYYSSGTPADQIARRFAEMWWNSSGHRRNMLGNHALIGVGVYQSGRTIYATQIFGR